VTSWQSFSLWETEFQQLPRGPHPHRLTFSLTFVLFFSHKVKKRKIERKAKSIRHHCSTCSSIAVLFYNRSEHGGFSYSDFGGNNLQGTYRATTSTNFSISNVLGICLCSDFPSRWEEKNRKVYRQIDRGVEKWDLNITI